MKRIGVLLCTAIALFLGGCGGSVTVGRSSGAYIRTPLSHDAGSLAEFVNLSSRPKSVLWETLNLSDPRVPGPTDWYLMALLLYGDDEVNAITRAAGQTRDPAVLEPGQMRPWFPDRLKADWTTEAGRYRFRGLTYRADSFYKGTLHDGYFVAAPNEREILLVLQCCTARIPGR